MSARSHEKWSYYFQDTEGLWSNDKKAKALAALTTRWKAAGGTGDMIVEYRSPIAQPNKIGPVIFQYEAVATAAEMGAVQAPSLNRSPLH